MSIPRLPLSCTPALALAASLMGAPAAHADSTLSIVAAYDYSSPTYVGNTYFEVVNDSTSVLTGISFSALGDGAAGSADTAVWTWTGLSIAAGSSVRLYFADSGTMVSGTGYGFTQDYQFTLAGNDQTYTFSGVADGQTYTASFSAASNATGSFVAFLGNDVYGDSLPADVAATVASVVVSAVPEPSTWALSWVGALALIARRRLARV